LLEFDAPPLGGGPNLAFGIASRISGESVTGGEAFEGTVPLGYDGIAGATTALEDGPYSIGTPEPIVGPQQSALRVLRVKTRLETRLKKPQGLNRPLQPPQDGPDWQPDCRKAKQTRSPNPGQRRRRVWSRRNVSRVGPRFCNQLRRNMFSILLFSDTAARVIKRSIHSVTNRRRSRMDGVIFGVTTPLPSRETVDGRNEVTYEENTVAKAS
jgi:hypothetical protein